MRFGAIGVLVMALLIGAVGLVAYNAGVSTGAAEAAVADGAAVVYKGAGWSPFGAIFGFFFLFLIFGFIVKAFAFRRWSHGHGGWGGRHGYGSSRWDDDGRDAAAGSSDDDLPTGRASATTATAAATDAAVTAPVPSKKTGRERSLREF